MSNSRTYIPDAPYRFVVLNDPPDVNAFVATLEGADVYPEATVPYGAGKSVWEIQGPNPTVYREGNGMKVDGAYELVRWSPAIQVPKSIVMAIY